MKIKKKLQINGTMLTKEQLEKHLEKFAAEQNIMQKSENSTYPVPQMTENFKIIQEVYNILNEHLRLGINIHPAGEWILDNLYSIEEIVKMIEKELTLKKYINFPGVASGTYKGFARIYVLASEIIAYTEGRIERENLEQYLISYQTKKTLSMDEIWNIGMFLEIAIIDKITEVCKSIYNAQMQKYKAEVIVKKIVENKKINKKNKIKSNIKEITFQNTKFSFIEYMSYILKRYGKKGYSYLNVLEEVVEMTGTTISDITKKEHFEMATKKVLIGNGIISIKKIQRLNFLEMFEKINGVEELLKQDPAEVYEKMDYKTKEYYRTKIKEISTKTKISEIYITKKVLEMARTKEIKKAKERHIGYYIIDKGIQQLYKKLGHKLRKKKTTEEKVNIYIISIAIFSALIATIFAYILTTKNIYVYILSCIIFLIPASELVIQIMQWILEKVIKPKMIPKIDMENGIDQINSTMVVIPTILDSAKKTKGLIDKLEVFYLANKSKNIYFTLLGDCTQSDFKEEKIDNEIIEIGKKEIEKLNKKYKIQEKEFPIFNFIYRERKWNEKQNKYLGWERKRGLLTQLNEYLLEKKENIFKTNTMEKYKENLPKIKYVITLDADTDLVLNSGFELIGTMAHILNKPIINKEKNIVIEGHGIIQPRVGVNLNISNKNLFTKIFAGAGGIDLYTNAISDIYQDNFEEGIFTGKGIYDVEIFSKVLKNEIPENTVLSHDLLEGNYLRAGLATNIMIMDGYPEKYTSFVNRLSRWIRGDWQILKWLTIKNKINKLSKYKIFDNLRRSLFEISIIIGYIYLNIIGMIYKKHIWIGVTLLSLIVILPFLLEIFNNVIGKKQGEYRQQTFITQITGIKGAIIRGIITFSCLPYKAYISLKAIIKTIYRMLISHKNLLEWTTSEEAEIQAKTDLLSYIKHMSVNLIIGTIAIILGMQGNIAAIIIGCIWISSPLIMWYISKEKNKVKALEKINEDEKQYILEIGKKTWRFFEDYLIKENNFLIPDNYQEGRKELVIKRTSSTNIGLSVLAVIAAYDLKYIKLEKCMNLIEKIILTISELPKWNGHLYNWYEIKTKIELMPRYISTVDSGNFIGYMYVLKQFLIEIRENIKEDKRINYPNEQIENLINIINKIIKETNFEVLYSKEQQIFSIGFNVEENKLTDSYYDLLASEARQASLIAIAKKDVPEKHWNNLSRTLTVVGKYKGLLSWSGTAFEYLMPNINIPKYEGSLLDESCKFMIMSQMEYTKKLNIPWGISESAFNLKDLHSNYQYKAFGIPWLGLKRGLADEMVVSPYGSILAINEVPKEVIKNLKELEQQGMYKKYGFYESIDYTPERVEKGKKASVVSTYMAHHQALNLLSINNLINNNIFQKRFLANPEIEAVSILLQERTPEKVIITKETKEKVEKLKYVDYENYQKREYRKIDPRIIRGNIISNENYQVAMDQKGNGISKYKEIYINRFKETKPFNQGIYMYIKDIKTKNIWSTSYNENENIDNQYKVSFMPDKNEIEKINGNIKSKMENIVLPKEPVEIRRLTLENIGNEDEMLEVTSYFEPVLSNKYQDYAHEAFNNLFLIFDFDNENKSIKVKRKKRGEEEREIYMQVLLNTESETIGELEYEIDKEKFLGRGNLGIPKMIKNSIPFSKTIGLVTQSILALKRTVKITAKHNVIIDLIISVGENEKNVKENIEKYKSQENVKKEFELSKAKIEEEGRYLRVKGNDIEEYQKIMTYIIFENPIRKINIEKLPKEQYKQTELWKYGISGDYPIILLKIKDVNDCYVIKEVLKAYEYLKNKNVETELVILDEEKYSYENYVKEEIESAILNNHMGYLKNIKKGIFNILKSEISKKDVELIEFIATIKIDASKGGIKNNIREAEEKYLEQYINIGEENKEVIVIEENKEDIDILLNKENLKYYNEYGGFSEDGKQYLIKTNKENRLPTVWSHIMANENFGTVVTENMGGYTWYKNSRLNRITTWENDAVLDIPSEVIYIKDEQTKKCWSLGQNPMPDDNNYNVIYGFGFAKYIHTSMGIEQSLEVFVPKKDSVKITILNLKNTTMTKRKLKIIQYFNLTIGEDELKSKGYIYTKQDINSNMIFSKNIYSSEFNDTVIYVSSSEKIKSYTGNKKFFLGNGGISNPDALKKIILNNENGFGLENCIAFELEVEIDSFSEKELAIIIGAEENIIDCKNMSYKYSKLANCKGELNEIKNYWNNILSRVQVTTPLESINILLNGWIPYQTMESRLLARSGFYQSGGAFGYRDQLQDTLSLKYIDPDILKNQIIKHSSHQFVEGDVEHWWHDIVNKGIRTKFSDDLLWLVYSVCEYIEFTGDESILDIETAYLKGEELKENEDEKYDIYLKSEIKESIYKHCIKAIEKGLKIGKNGIPKIGTGDWNDGLNKVGNKGEGESVWLGFFIYDILNKFIPICEKKGDIQLKEKYKQIQNDLKRALNTKGWDGRWYKRAFMDNGKVLGSMENDECKIDNIAQSWSVISNGGDNDKKYISMESLENHLIDNENGIIKLLDPPFEKGGLEPGYIKSYLPGVRENGGQYTHAATWVIMAEALLGFGDKALELYRMITPIEHARTKESVQKYKVEPYVIAADIYGAKNLAGRGGWTWYTGSSSWYYKVGIENIIGLKIEKGIMKFNPCIPKKWKEYEIRFKWKNNIYNIKIENPNAKNTGIEKIYLDDKEIENAIRLEEKSKVYSVRIIM